MVIENQTCCKLLGTKERMNPCLTKVNFIKKSFKICWHNYF